MTDRILGLIGMMRRASALVIGEDRVSEAIQQGRVKILMIPSDAEDGVRKYAVCTAEKKRLQMIELPYQKDMLSAAIGISNCRIAAITDLGFAKAVVDLLKKQNPGKYEREAESINRRFEKRERRKREKPGLKTKKKSAGKE